MGDALQGVLDGMGKVVHGENAPFGALPVVLDVPYPVEHRVAHVEVAGSQVDPGPEGIFPLGEFAGPHPAEKIEAFGGGPVPVWAAGRDAHIPAIFAELLRGQLTDIGKALIDQFLGIFIGFIKIIRAVEEPVFPIKAEPADVFLDGVDKFGILLGRIRIIHAQVADAAVFFRGAEVYAKGLAMADVQVAVGFRRKTGMNPHPLKSSAVGQVFFNKYFYKVFCRFFHVFHSI